MLSRALTLLYNRLKINLPRLVQELQINEEFSEQVFLNATLWTEFFSLQNAKEFFQDDLWSLFLSCIVNSNSSPLNIVTWCAAAAARVSSGGRGHVLLEHGTRRRHDRKLIHLTRERRSIPQIAQACSQQGGCAPSTGMAEFFGICFVSMISITLPLAAGVIFCLSWNYDSLAGA